MRFFSLVALLAVAGVYVATPQPVHSEDTLSQESQDVVLFLQHVAIPIGPDLLNDFSRLPRDTPQQLWAGIVETARHARLPLELKRLTLRQLREQGGVALVRLSGPDALAVITSVGTQNALLFSHGQPFIITNDTLQQRLTSDALVMARRPGQRSALVVDDGVRVVPVDFRADKEIIQTIHVANRGEGKLGLELLGTSCGCTGADIKPKTLLPGQPGEVIIKMHLDGGSKLVTVSLRSTDVLWPAVTLAVATQTPKTPIRPPGPIFISSQLGQPAATITTLVVPTTATITNAQAKLPFLAAKIDGLDTSLMGKSYRIKVTVAGDAPAGPFSDDVVVNFEDPAMPHLTIPVQGYIDADIGAEPGIIALGAVLTGTTIKSMVTVRNPKGQPFSLTGVKTSNAKIKVKAPLDAPAVEHKVEIEFPVAGEAGANIFERIQLSLSDGRDLNVDILGVIKNSVQPVAP